MKMAYRKRISICLFFKGYLYASHTLFDVTCVCQQIA